MGIRHPLPYSLRQNSAVHAVMYHQAGAKSIALNLMLSLSIFFFSHPLLAQSVTCLLKPEDKRC